MLPKKPPQVAGYDIAGTSLPAQSVGGDYFDFIPCDDDRLAICLGDVTGKGLPASLLMANLQATIRGQTLADAAAKTCLTRANKLLCQSTDKCNFITFFLWDSEPSKSSVHLRQRRTQPALDHLRR
ncbi:MAG: SpoIIE family protein phosphatase [candidate division KSB1 bacterium]|nr:SpoIIE family protein phosphatase [candidate division KSB1 bacterium]MDZ7365111.1 SpoIIE family protein phosphatase [candidate division KSB1 bacterium]MDZ7404321.1 SpoIIE family protein phosphatase [candidate division KSB1 bacterium]